jgi:tetratricopeptide (TPR) repeat protein
MRRTAQLFFCRAETEKKGGFEFLVLRYTLFDNQERKASMEDQFQTLVQDGIAAANAGNTSLALRHLLEAADLDESPELHSHLAYCLAKENHDFPQAISLGRSALRDEPWNSRHYLNLGRIYLLSGRRQDAIRIFRDGLLHENNPRIKEELARLGTRKYPVIASLPREHTLNRLLGKFFSRLKLR